MADEAHEFPFGFEDCSSVMHFGSHKIVVKEKYSNADNDDDKECNGNGERTVGCESLEHDRRRVDSKSVDC